MQMKSLCRNIACPSGATIHCQQSAYEGQCDMTSAAQTPPVHLRNATPHQSWSVHSEKVESRDPDVSLISGPGLHQQHQVIEGQNLREHWIIELVVPLRAKSPDVPHSDADRGLADRGLADLPEEDNCMA